MASPSSDLVPGPKSFFSRYHNAFPNGHRVVLTDGEGKLCGLNAIVISAKEQHLRPRPYLKDLQAIVDGDEYLACTVANSPEEVKAVTKDNFTQDQLALILKLYGDKIEQPLQLALGKLSQPHLHPAQLTDLSVVQNKDDSDFQFSITPHPQADEAKLIWIHSDNAENAKEGVLGHFSGLKTQPYVRIQGHADPTLPTPDTLVKVGKNTSGKVTWVRAQIMHPDKNGDVKKYPQKEIRGQEGISLKLMRMGGELYPHLLLEAKVDVLEEIAGLTAKKTKSRATAKFNLDSPQGFFHASNITVGHPEPSKKSPNGGTVRFTFMSQTGATTERCDVVDPEYSDETKTTLSLMQSMQKSGKVDLILHYQNSKSLQRLLETLEDFKNHRPHNWLPYIYDRYRTAATVFGSHHRREDVLNTVLYDN